MKIPDIDIDFKTSFKPEKIFQWTRASSVRDEQLVPHPCGYYPQKIPVDGISRLSSIPYQDAEELGFFKIDFLHLGVYDNFSSREEIEELVKLDPNWDLLLDKEIQPKLFQLSKHGDVIDIIKPRSVEELADVLALIRPGKKNLVKLYRANKNSTRKILYQKSDDGYTFKKSHAIAYSLVIVLQLHLFELGIA